MHAKEAVELVIVATRSTKRARGTNRGRVGGMAVFVANSDASIRT
jgi:hypothetical protein